MKDLFNALKTKIIIFKAGAEIDKSFKDMDILDHIEKIVEIAKKHGIDLCQIVGKKHLDYVTEKLGISPLQAVLFSLMVEKTAEKKNYLSEIAETGKSSKVRVIKYINDCEVLESKKLIRCNRSDDSIAYRVPRVVRESLRKHDNYIPEKNENLSIEEFFGILEKLFEERENYELTFKILKNELIDLINQNMHLLFCKRIVSFNLDEDALVLLLCFCHLAGNNGDDDIGGHDIIFLYDNKYLTRHIKKDLSNGDHELIEAKLVEYNNNNGFINNESWKLSDMAKKELLSELDLKFNKSYKKGLIHFDSIKHKKMFYNSKETKEIQTLISLLQEENYRKIQERLDKKGMRKGFVCLFSGPPGTGKTETAYQIARETKRNIMAVDISQTKSCWFGESEKKIKEIFNNYRNAVDNSSIAPILLFNEADAIIGKRKEFNAGSRAVDQTENTIQNIILQEMENLSGILIATTNLTQNMDSAFERRFLYKITFDKPGIESRKGIWNALLPDLPEERAAELSGKFDLSGGQIENISRKVEVDAILNGNDLPVDTLVQYCKDETQNSFNSTKKIGFCVE